MSKILLKLPIRLRVNIKKLPDLTTAPLIFGYFSHSSKRAIKLPDPISPNQNAR